MSLRYFTLDVFTDRPFGGNPLAVFCDQPGLPDEAMQAIAREFNLSETVFIVPPRDPRALRRLRIFTPTRELPFAGHPTIGASHMLVDLGIAPASGDFALELNVGLVPIQVTPRENAPAFLQLTAARLPEFGPPAPPVARLAQSLGLDERDVLSNADFPEAASCGTPYLFVPVRDRAVLARARAVTGPWNETLRNYWAESVFVFCRDPELPGSHIRARMFAPEFGIVEDPATGSAAAAFAGYLAKREPAGTTTLRWRVEQGFEMGRPSLLYVEADKRGDAVTAVRVGGTAVKMSEGTLLRVPPK
jgi:trans-2,3-dihydro-3-hydroxyanthranilate isomerase